MIKKITFGFFLLLSLTIKAQQATHLNFDGENDFVDIGNTMNTVLDDVNTFTVEAFVRPTTSSGIAFIIGNDQFLLERNGSTYIFYIDSSAGFVSIVVSGGVTLNTWQHIAATWDGTTMEFYVDGVSRGTTSATGTNFKTTTNNIRIGGNAQNRFFRGDIGEIRIWKKVRTALEILNNKDLELQGLETGLLAYYKFNQGIHASNNSSVTKLIDATNNDFKGTLNGFPLSGATSNWIFDESTPACFENSTPSSSSITATGFTLNTDINEAGKIYYVVLTSGTTMPTAAEVKAGTGANVVASGNAVVNTSPFTKAFSVTGLTTETSYDVYVVAEDDESTPNLKTAPIKIDVITADLNGSLKHGIITFFKPGYHGNITTGEISTQQACESANNDTFNGITIIPSNKEISYWVFGHCLTPPSITTPTTFTFSKSVNVVSMQISTSDTWTITPSSGSPITYTGAGVIFLGFKDVTSFTVSGASSFSYSWSNIRIADDIWTGTTDTDWATETNWVSGTVPTSAKGIVISDVTNKPIISATTGAVANDIIIDASAALTVENGGSLIVDGTATVNGDFISKINVPDTKWHLVSSPVKNEQYDDIWNDANGINTGGTGSNEAVAKYINTSNVNGDWVYYQNNAGATDFEEGIGYSLKRTSVGDYTFTGKTPAYPTNSSITATDIGTPASENRWNLIGNPFPAYINIATFLTANTTPLKDTHESVYVWNASANEYQGLTTGYIKPGQAFFVSSNVASSTITFTKGMQSHQTGVTFYKTSNPKILLTIDDGSNKKSTEINYLADKTTGLDPRFDVGTFTGQGSNLDIYTYLVSNSKGVNFMKQTLPDANYENMIIPVGLYVKAGKEITFTTEVLNLPSGVKVYLEDKKNNVFTRLDEVNDTYKITSPEALNGIGRFYLHTTSSALSIDKELVLENISIYKLNTTTLRIAGLENSKTNVKIFNAQGKKVLNTSFQSNGVKDISLPKLASGVYIVNLQTDKGKLNKKIIIK